MSREWSSALSGDGQGQRDQLPGKLEKILAAAVEIIGSEGPHAVTHRKVAAHAGVSLGLTTYYFKDRGDLLFRAEEYAYVVEEERLRSLVEEATLNGNIEAIAELLTAMFFDKAVADPLYDIALFEMFLEATRNERVRTVTTRWSHLIFDLIDRVLPEKIRFQPREMAIQILAATIDGLMLEETSNKELGIEGLKSHLEAVLRLIM